MHLVRKWPIATDRILVADRRFRGITDMAGAAAGWTRTRMTHRCHSAHRFLAMHNTLGLGISGIQDHGTVRPVSARGWVLVLVGSPSFQRHSNRGRCCPTGRKPDGRYAAANQACAATINVSTPVSRVG